MREGSHRRHRREFASTVRPPTFRRRRRLGITAAVAFAAAAAVSFGTAPSTHATGAVGFAPPTFVDMVRAGGEPGIIHSSKFGTLIYSSHEGTTHIDRVGITSNSTAQFLCPNLGGADCYRNRVWIWTSDDNGATWTLRDQGFAGQGFSDPDLTEDAAGTIYDTGIDLANDSVFSSKDGGKTWPNGTTNCHEGDRPWLAGGVAGEVFMSTDDEVSTGNPMHTLFHSTDYANSCGSNGIVDMGAMPNGDNWEGFGKGVYDPVDRSFIEPAQFTTPGDPGPAPPVTQSSSLTHVGISILPNAADAFSHGGETFHPVEVAATPGVFSPFGAPEVVSMDSAENIYFAWDTDDRDATRTAGCGNGATPLPNRIMLEVGKKVGPGQWQFLPPISLAHQGNARVLWPWSVAGSAGNVSVVWYQMDKMVDPDCDQYHGATIADARTYIYEAHISNATDPATRQITVTNASGRFIHEGGICDSGTTCVATGQDRRLGDYFTNSVDARGCVIIASGDTTVLDDTVSGQPRITSLPVFIRQNSGPSLTTGADCGATTATTSGGVQGTTTTSSSSSASSSAQPAAAAMPNTASGAGAAAGATALAAAVLALSAARRRPARRGRAGPP
jgi:hypothetical protein